jgi:hypothetical protein
MVSISSSFKDIYVVLTDPFTHLSNTEQDENHKDGNKFMGIIDTSSKVFSNAYVYYSDVITY